MESAASFISEQNIPQNHCGGESCDPALKAVAGAISRAEAFVPPPEPPKSEKPTRIGDSGIIPLGHLEGSYFFISVNGEKREFKARDLVRLNIASLFGGDTSWLCRMFPCFNKKGEPIDDAFSANGAAEWLMRACSMRGLFNKETPIRGLGVWRYKDDVVAHLGSTVWYRGEKRKSGCVIGGAIYPARTKLEEPDFDNPADAYECKRLRQYMNAWDFPQEFDADLLFGWMGAGVLGGFPSWRVHALVTAERGSGKSTLAEFLMNALGAQGTSMNDYTEAGLRQTLTNEGRTTHLDEGESSGDEKAHRMAKVIGLLRLMSGGTGARIARGSSGGTAMSSTVTGCVLLTAINPPPLQPQDKSRILIVPIQKFRHVRSQEDIQLFLDEAKRLSPRLRARALMGVARFSETVALYRRLLVAHGCDARQADLYATLCGGRSLLIHDAVPSEAEALDFVNNLKHRLSLIMLEDSDTSDAQSCLNRLMDASCEAIRDGIKRSIGMVVASGMDETERPENDKLVPLGIKIIDSKEEGRLVRYLFVANDHLGLRKIFYNTPWADGNWRTSLIRLKGVRPSPKPVSIGRKARGLLIPSGLLPEPDTGNIIQDFRHEADPAPPRGQT